MTSGTAATWAPEHALGVYLNGTLIGHLARRGLTAWFSFAPDYARAGGERNILGLRFEENLGKSHYGHDRLPAWFSNLLPEGELRRLYANAASISSRSSGLQTEWSILERVGLDLPGAVQVIPARVEDVGIEQHSQSNTPLLPYQSSSLHDDVLRFSVAGVGMKLSMLREGTRFTAPAAGQGGRWLVKLPDLAFPDLPINEFAVMTLASRAGLNIPEIRYVHRDEVDQSGDQLWGNEQHAYAIERFDRLPDGSGVHIEDLAQVRGFYPDDKYKSSFATVGSLLYRGKDRSSLVEFVERLTFNLMVANGDAHLKNWSLIYDNPRSPRISPAYDIVSLAPYWSNTKLATDLGLRFGNNRSFDQVNLDSFVRLERKLGTDIALADIAAATRDRVVDSLDVLDDLLAKHPKMLRAIREHAESMSARLR